ncbi:MAG: hypothetical protein DI498_14835 [Paracoccus denitrificans]|nr:MAG: hypothetical protein DI498_14835 [Paracoccus denitrificans]PZO82600.1 MAG: hypothetical protein DI633_14835 [Paracoccus denitrificans]
MLMIEQLGRTSLPAKPSVSQLTGAFNKPVLVNGFRDSIKGGFAAAAPTTLRGVVEHDRDSAKA